MRKVFEEYGGIIVVVAAVCAVLGLLVVLLLPGGAVNNAFGSMVNSFSGNEGGAGGTEPAPDMMGPSLFVSPTLGKDSANPLVLDSDSLDLSGAAADKSGVAFLTVNGAEVAVGADGKWSTTLTLAEGEITTVTVVATDGVGNTTTQTGYVQGPIQYTDFIVTADNRWQVGYTGAEGENLVIPGTFQGEDGKWYRVVLIGSYAFQDCTNLVSITIPDGVTGVGVSAFQGCTNLSNITLPEGVAKIGDYAFYHCSSLSSIIIPDSVTAIGPSAFEGCTGLTEITIPGRVTEIEAALVRGCTKMTNITIPDSVTGIGWYAFQNCTSLTNITIPDSVTSIGDYAFQGCSGLVSITIPDSVTHLGNFVFWSCTNLTELTIPSSATNIGHNLVAGCTKLTSVTFENTSGWWVSTDSAATSGDSVDVRDAAANVTYFKSTYYNYYWFRSTGGSTDTSAMTANWAALVEASEDGSYATKYPVGTEVELELQDGTTAVFVVVAHNQDALADGSGTAHMTLISKGILGTYKMNETYTSDGGWEASGLRAYLQTNPYLPAEVMAAVKTVSKTSYDYNGGDEGTLTTTDQLWIPSCTEIGLTDSTINGAESSTVYSCFADNAARVKYNSSGSAASWWLRSAYYNTTGGFCCVDGSGANSGFPAYLSCGVVLGFCI